MMVSRENGSTCVSERHRSDGAGKKTLAAEMTCKKCPKNVNFAQLFVEILRFTTMITLIILNQDSVNFISLSAIFPPISNLGALHSQRQTLVSSYMFNEELCCFIKFLLCPRRNFMHN